MSLTTTSAENLSPNQQAGLPAGSVTRSRRFSFSFGFKMVLPTIIALIAVVGFPVSYALYVAFHEYDLTEGGIGEMIGFENFSAVLNMDVFEQAVRNTAVLTVSVVVLELVGAFGLALLLNQDGLRFRNLYLGILL